MHVKSQTAGFWPRMITRKRSRAADELLHAAESARHVCARVDGLVDFVLPWQVVYGQQECAIAAGSPIKLREIGFLARVRGSPRKWSASGPQRADAQMQAGSSRDTLQSN